MALTSKQEKFCIEYASGKSKSEAYRIAYDAENMKPETINSKAYVLSEKDEIRARIKELQKPVQEQMLITLKGQIKYLSDIYALAIGAEKYSDAINALKEQNKLLALYEEHNKQKTPLSAALNIDNATPEQIEALATITGIKST